MTVAELIKLLKKQPQDIQVIYSLYSEQILMQPDHIAVVECCAARPDGWVHSARPDQPAVTYLLFPGN